MRAKIAAAVVMLMVMVAGSLCRADSIEQIEAKKRGVAVEVVQLEDARGRIASLEKQNAELTSKVAILTKQLAEAKIEMAPAAPSSSIAIAIKEHRLVQGMTLEEAKAAVPGSWVQQSESDGVQHYVCSRSQVDAEATEAARSKDTFYRKVEVASVDVQATKVIHCETMFSTLELTIDPTAPAPKAKLKGGK